MTTPRASSGKACSLMIRRSYTRWVGACQGERCAKGHSKRLQILDHRRPIRRRERIAEQVPAVAIAGQRRVVDTELLRRIWLARLPMIDDGEIPPERCLIVVVRVVDALRVVFP